MVPGWLGTDAAAGILARAGIPMVTWRTCATVGEAETAAEDLGYPVVAKVLHSSLLHKSDAGGVRVGLLDRAAVRDAAAELLSLVRDGRVLIQGQAAGTEVIVGGVRDPQFGPAVLVGLGGVLVEAIDDVVLRLAPLRHEDAGRLLRQLRGFGVLAGVRGLPPVDLDALSALICAVGDLLAAVPEIAELDLNPVLASASGCVAVDWRILVANQTPQDEVGSRDSPRHTGETDLRSP